jgi:two-component system, LytTR family, sensor kinase
MTETESRARMGSEVLTALVAGVAGAVLLTLVSTTQLSVLLRDQTPHTSFAGIFVGELIYWSPWVLLAPAITVLGWHWRFAAGRVLRRLPVWVVAALLAGLVDVGVMTVLSRVLHVRLFLAGSGVSQPFLVEMQSRFFQTFLSNILVFAVAVLLYHALVYYSANQDRARREAALEAELARFRLHVLQSQLQPHFLFNALHTVSALMADDVAAARRVLAELGDLLRMALDRMDDHEIELERELEFLRRYLDIQTARFGDRLAVEWHIEERARSTLIPSMLLQPCVENAVQHGIEPVEGGGRVVITAGISDGLLHIDIADNGRGAAGRDGRGASGRGLTNVQERLRARYGARQSFEAADMASGGFRVRIALPAESARPADTASVLAP